MRVAPSSLKRKPWDTAMLACMRSASHEHVSLSCPHAEIRGRQIVTSYRIDSHSHRFTPKVPARVLPTIKCRKASNSSRRSEGACIENYKPQILARLTEQGPLPPISPLDVHNFMFPHLYSEQVCERIIIREAPCMQWILRRPICGLRERQMTQQPTPTTPRPHPIHD